MGRSRAYNEDVVLTGAMHAFRRKGYVAVSIRDLEEATGLKAGSIYNSYGDKAGLFEAAFAHYNRAVLRRRIAEHASATSGLGGLRALFLSLLQEPNGESFGCLITNSAVEFGGSPPLGVREGLKLLSETFVECLSSALAAGVLRNDIDPSSAAQRLLVLYQGILVLVRAGHDKATLEHVINDDFDALEEPQHDA
ncbi:MAG: TetR/AcrR family transcriptional regulator [Stellaceae bacterium]